MINFFVDMYEVGELRFKWSVQPAEEVDGDPMLVVFSDRSYIGCLHKVEASLRRILGAFGSMEEQDQAKEQTHKTSDGT